MHRQVCSVQVLRDLQHAGVALAAGLFPDRNLGQSEFDGDLQPMPSGDRMWIAGWLRPQ